MDIRCAVDDHRQLLGAVRLDSGVAHFTRVPPTDTLLGDRYEDPYYERNPQQLRRLKMTSAMHPSLGYVEIDGDDPPPQRFESNRLVTSWWWLDPEDAAAQLIEPSRAQMWMDPQTFWSGTESDWLHYWCPRHGDLQLTAGEIHKAIDRRKDALARAIRNSSP